MRLLLSSLLLSLVALSACGGETVALQAEYVSVRNDCQGYAENRVETMEKAEGLAYAGKERNAHLVENFNRCMENNNWDMGKPKDVPARAGDKTNPKDTELVRRGIGIGVGPTYALEEKPAGKDESATPSSVMGEQMKVAPNTAQPPRPVVVREPKGGIDLRGHELPKVQGEIPKVQGELPRPTATMPRSAAAGAAQPSVSSATPPTRTIQPTVSPNASSRISSETEEELKKAIGQ